MPEPILIAIAAAIAGKSVGNLYDVVRKKFAGNKEATTALAAATGTPPDSAQVHTLANHLATATNADPQFAATLQTLWAQSGGTVNQISGTVTGNVIQTHTIQGNITFGN